jgi:hypothetical protein
MCSFSLRYECTAAREGGEETSDDLSSIVFMGQGTYPASTNA